MKVATGLPALAVVIGSASASFAGLAVYVNPANGHEYILTPAPMTWQDAQAFSRSVGGYLASVGDQAENDWITTTFAVALPAPDYVWIGLTDRDVEGTFTWDSGEPLAYTNWFPGEPNNFPSSPEGEDFATLTTQDGTGRWFDTPSPTYNGLPYLVYGVVEIVPAPAAIGLVGATVPFVVRRRRVR